MKYVLLILLLCAQLIFPQTLQQKIDSLQKAAETLPDSAKSRICNELSALYRNVDPELSNKQAQDALTLSKRAGTTQQTIQAMINLGICQYMQGENTEAFTYYYEAKEIAERIGSKYLLGKIYNNIGAVYFNLGDYNRTLEFYLKSQVLRQEIHDREGVAASYNNLGNVYLSLGNYALSLEQYQKSLDLKNELRDEAGIIQTLINLGTVYKYLGDNTKALEYYNNALRLSTDAGMMLFTSTALGNIGGVFANQSDYKKSLEYHARSLVIRKKIGDINGETVCLINMGENYYELKNYAQALRYVKSGLDAAKKAELSESGKNAHFLMSQIHEKMGNFQEAYMELQKYNELHDSLFNSVKANEIGRLQERSDIEKMLMEKQRYEEEQAKIAADKTRHRNLIQYFSIFLVVLALFVGVFFTGKIKMKESAAEGLAFFAFLILYEFIAILLDPMVDSISMSIPVMKLFVNAFIALLMTPVHDILENALEKKVIKR